MARDLYLNKDVLHNVVSEHPGSYIYTMRAFFHRDKYSSLILRTRWLSLKMDLLWCYLLHDNYFYLLFGPSHLVTGPGCGHMPWTSHPVFGASSMSLIRLSIPQGQFFVPRSEEFRTHINGWIRTSASHSSD